MAEVKDRLWELYRAKDFQGAYQLAKGVLEADCVADALHIAGLSLISQGHIEPGCNLCVASLLLVQPLKDWPRNVALALLARKEAQQALDFVMMSLDIDPDDSYTHYVHGLCLSRMLKFGEALEAIDKSIELNPEFARAKAMRGYALHALLRHEEAIEQYERVLMEHDLPARDREDVVNNLSSVHSDMGESAAALYTLEKDYEHSVNPLTVYNRSIIYLGMGDWPRAWDMYRARYDVAFDDRRVPRVAIEKHADVIDDVFDRSVMMYHEQGIGDTIQFMRYAFLLRPFVGHLALLMQPSLCRLARLLDINDSFDVVEDTGDASVYDHYPVTVCMMDAPRLFGTTVLSIPGIHARYLRRVPRAIMERRALPPTDRPRIGLCWAGAKRSEIQRAVSWDQKRSMAFEDMLPFVKSDRFDFVSLQQEHPVPEYYVGALHEVITPDFDLLDTAAIIEQCDLVITVDTSVAHLAGALHKPTWLLLCYANCWRWFYNDSRSSPWYPTMRLYRQPRRGDWESVIKSVCVDLEVFCEERV